MSVDDLDGLDSSWINIRVKTPWVATDKKSSLPTVEWRCSCGDTSAKLIAETKGAAYIERPFAIRCAGCQSSFGMEG